MSTDTTAKTPVRAVAPGVNGNGNYNEDSIDVKRDAEHIRARPGMYIGSLGSHGLHHLVDELVGNSVDEALAGYCKTVNVWVHKDGSLSVADDGRGIPVEEHPTEKKPTLEVVMTTVGAGGKFGKGSYKVSVGLHGVGAKAVTALSEWTEAQVMRDGRTWQQEYEKGKAVTPVKDLGPASRTGTRIRFKPDPEFFPEIAFDYEALAGRLRELSYLNNGLALILHDERDGKTETFKSQGGLAEFLAYLNHDEEPLHPAIVLDKTEEEVHVNLALQFVRSEAEDRVKCYANNAYNVEGGTHLAGLRAALTHALKTYGTKENYFKDVTPTDADYREGLTGVLSIQVPEPKFSSQDKRKLINAEVKGIVQTVVSDFLGTYLEEHPKEAKAIMQKVVLAAEAREAALKAKNALKSRKSILSGGGLPGKLFDCTNRNREEAELFLVEGDSAGGSAESGRDRSYQAVLPLRGKPLNVEKAKLESMLENKEICSLISALGVDIGNNEDIDGLRYDKIILLSDADVDGQHIRTLLLTFFYRQMAKLVAEGKIYVARPPLYKVTQKKHVEFVQTPKEIQERLTARGLDGTKFTILPVEGTADELRTLAGKEMAALVKVVADLEESLVLLERSGLNLASFVSMGTEQGLPSVRVTLGGKEHWFHTVAQKDAFIQAERERLGKELVLVDDVLGQTAATTNGHPAETYEVHEFHEVRKVNKALGELAKYHLKASDLVPQPRLAGREPPPRLVMENGDSKKVLPTLRELVVEVRRLGERGLSVTRFKGLGEMDPEELWDTTLDPERRTLMRVTLEDAFKADELFRVLMGEKVEPRRDFIFENALKVKDVDMHGA